MILAFNLSDIVTVPFGWLLAQLYHFTDNYGAALIIFALAVQAILETLGHYALADRAFLFNLTEGGRTFRNSFEWCRSGVSTQQGNLQDIAPEEIPVWMETFRSGSSIVIRDLEDVRETSPSEYALMKPQDIRREIASPIFYKGSLGGFLGLDNPGIEDTKSLVELLQLVGSHFGSSLENTRMVTALKRSVEDLRREQQILNVLCEDYTAVYRADLLNDRASVVKMSRNSNIYEIQIRNRGEDLPYTAFLQEYCADYVVPEDRERLLRELLPENLRQTLKKQRRVLHRIAGGGSHRHPHRRAHRRCRRHHHQPRLRRGLLLGRPEPRPELARNKKRRCFAPVRARRVVGCKKTKTPAPETGTEVLFVSRSLDQA